MIKTKTYCVDISVNLWMVTHSGYNILVGNDEDYYIVCRC